MSVGFGIVMLGVQPTQWLSLRAQKKVSGLWAFSEDVRDALAFVDKRDAEIYAQRVPNGGVQAIPA